MTVDFNKYSRYFLTGLAIILICIGCSGLPDDHPVLNAIHGTVLLDGQPLPQATITILPEAGPPSGAITDANGNYEVMHKSGKKGAVAGPAKVSIITSTIDENGELTLERLPGKYNTETTLSITVKEGNNSQDFILTSK